MQVFKLAKSKLVDNLNEKQKTNTLNMVKIKTSLNDIKSKLDNIYKNNTDDKKSFNANNVMRVFDPFRREKYIISKRVNAYNITNAWLKCYEIIEKFQLIQNKEKLTYFDNASFPGSFILAVNHYVKTKTNIKDFTWFASSLLDEHNLQDEYNLYKNYPENWLIDKYNNGDVTKKNNVLDFKKKIFKKEKNGIDLYSCDLGIGVEKSFNNQEELHFKANFFQIMCGLLVLKENGNMFIKHYTLFEDFTISYLAFLTILFNEIYIYKPISSRRTNSEIYIICKEYKKNNDSKSIENTILSLFKSRMENFNINPFFIDKIDINPTLQSLVYICETVYNSQIENLNMYINICNNKLNKRYNENISIIKKIKSTNKKLINKFNEIPINCLSKNENLKMKKKY